jgi:hypothetical protein
VAPVVSAAAVAAAAVAAAAPAAKPAVAAAPAASPAAKPAAVAVPAGAARGAYGPKSPSAVSAGAARPVEVSPVPSATSCAITKHSMDWHGQTRLLARSLAIFRARTLPAPPTRAFLSFSAPSIPPGVDLLDAEFGGVLSPSIEFGGVLSPSIPGCALLASARKDDAAQCPAHP